MTDYGQPEENLDAQVLSKLRRAFDIALERETAKLEKHSSELEEAGERLKQERAAVEAAHSHQAMATIAELLAETMAGQQRALGSVETLRADLEALRADMLTAAGERATLQEVGRIDQKVDDAIAELLAETMAGQQRALGSVETLRADLEALRADMLTAAGGHATRQEVGRIDQKVDDAMRGAEEKAAESEALQAELAEAVRQAEFSLEILRSEVIASLAHAQEESDKRADDVEALGVKLLEDVKQQGKALRSEMLVELEHFREGNTRYIAEEWRQMHDVIASLRLEIAQVRQDYEQRAAETERAARGREHAFQEMLSQERLRAALAVSKEMGKAEWLNLRVGMLDKAVVTTGGDAPTGMPDTLYGFLEASDFIAPQAEAITIETAIAWLAHDGEAVIASGLSAAFEVAAASRWPREVFVTAAYRWLLDRDPEEAGLSHYIHELRHGFSRRDVLCEISLSDEAVARLKGEAVASEADDAGFIASAYQRLLGRRADRAGLDHYLSLFSRGATRERVLGDIVSSGEARRSGTPIAAALRSITYANSRPARWRRKLEALNPRHGHVRRRVWQAGRLAELEAEARRAFGKVQARIDAINAHADDLVAIVRANERSRVLAEIGGGAGGSAKLAPVKPAPSSHKVDLLGDSSGERTVGQIADAIRAELNELGIN